jgi:hypothetical protein
LLIVFGNALTMHGHVDVKKKVTILMLAKQNNVCLFREYEISNVYRTVTWVSV